MTKNENLIGSGIEYTDYNILPNLPKMITITLTMANHDNGDH